jgi:hypothetical protein
MLELAIIDEEESETEGTDDLLTILEKLETKAERLEYLSEQLVIQELLKIEFTLLKGMRLTALKEITRLDYEKFHRQFYGTCYMPFTPAMKRRLTTAGINVNLLTERVMLEYELMAIEMRLQLYSDYHRRTELEQSLKPLRVPDCLSDYFGLPGFTYADFDALLEQSGITLKGRIRKNGIAAKTVAIVEWLLQEQLLASNHISGFRNAFTAHYCGQALVPAAYSNCKKKDKGNIETYRKALFEAFTHFKKVNKK